VWERNSLGIALWSQQVFIQKLDYIHDQKKYDFMSQVTNLILTFSIGEDEDRCINAVNSYEYRNLKMNLVSVDFNKDLEKGTTWYGGTKFMEARIYLGAFNYLDIQDFRNYLKTIAWQYPDLVQLIVQEQDDDKFKIIEL